MFRPKTHENVIVVWGILHSPSRLGKEGEFFLICRLLTTITQTKFNLVSD